MRAIELARSPPPSPVQPVVADACVCADCTLAGCMDDRGRSRSDLTPVCTPAIMHDIVRKEAEYCNQRKLGASDQSYRFFKGLTNTSFCYRSLKPLLCLLGLDGLVNQLLKRDLFQP